MKRDYIYESEFDIPTREVCHKLVANFKAKDLETSFKMIATFAEEPSFNRVATILHVALRQRRQNEGVSS